MSESADGELLDLREDADVNADGSITAQLIGSVYLSAFVDDEDAIGFFDLGSQAVTVTTNNGECDENCAEETSCSFDIVLTITGDFFTDEVTLSAPAMTLAAPAGLVLDSTESAVSTSVAYFDLETNTTTYEVEWTWTGTVTPGCGVSQSPSSVDITWGEGNLSLTDPSPWLPLSAGGSDDTTLVFGCEPCDGTKTTTSTPSTGKQQQKHSIEVTDLAGKQGEATADADAQGTTTKCEGCAPGDITRFDTEEQAWLFAGYGAVLEGTAYGDDSLTQDPTTSSFFISSVGLDFLGSHPGECEKNAYGDCVQKTSCSQEILVSLSGTISSTDDLWTGPDLIHSQPPGWAPDLFSDGEPYGKEIGTPQTFDVETGMYSRPVTWRWLYTFKPGCGSTVESAISLNDFRLAKPESDTMTYLPEDDVEVGRFRMSCDPCAKKKPAPLPTPTPVAEEDATPPGRSTETEGGR